MPRPARNSELLSLLAVLAVALAWRVLFFLSIQNTPLAFWHTWDQSDMHSFLEQARALAAGDWLARAPYHPYHEWMRVAPPASWQAFFTRPAFYQAPLYSYFLALLLRLGLDAALWARLIQLLLGVAGVGLLYGITRRLFGRGAALAAGLLMAVYGPLLVVESQLLRDTPILFLTLLIFFCYQSWTRRPRRAASAPLALGVPLGLLALAHEGAALLAISVAAAGFFHSRRSRARRAGRAPALRWLTLLFIGILAGYAPLLVRNLIVGAPAGPRFAGSAFAWAVANHATAPWGGAIWMNPTPAFGETLRRSGGGIPSLIGGVLASYHGQWWLWLAHWAGRLAALGSGAENNENVCQAYFAARVPILAFSVDFRILLPLALAGAVLWGRRRWAAALRGGSVAAALALNLVLVAGLLSLVLPLGRYRLMFLPALLPFAGHAVFSLGSALSARALRARRPRRLALGAGVIALVALGQWGLGRALPVGGLRPTDFKVAAKILLDLGRPDLARAELESAAQAGLDPREFELELAIAIESAGAEPEAAARYERLLSREPARAIALLRLGWLRAAAHDPAVRQPARALDLARRYAALPEASAVESADLQAAAQAAAGDFPSAAGLAAQALAAARREGRQPLARQIESRLALYRQRQPFTR